MPCQKLTVKRPEPGVSDVFFDNFEQIQFIKDAIMQF